MCAVNRSHKIHILDSMRQQSLTHIRSYLAPTFAEQSIDDLEKGQVCSHTSKLYTRRFLYSFYIQNLKFPLTLFSIIFDILLSNPLVVSSILLLACSINSLYSLQSWLKTGNSRSIIPSASSVRFATCKVCGRLKHQSKCQIVFLEFGNHLRVKPGL